MALAKQVLEYVYCIVYGNSYLFYSRPIDRLARTCLSENAFSNNHVNIF